MKIKPLILATALALSAFTATSSYAANYTVELGGPSAVNSYSANYGALLTVAGAFADTFTFTPSISGWSKGSLVTTSFNHHDNIHFTSATLNDVPFDLGSAGPNNEFGFTSVVFSNAPIIIKVFGIAAPALAAGTVVAAAYSGTLTVSAIPEPETYAMMLAGLGLVGFMARRRKKTESKETLPQLSAC